MRSDYTIGTATAAQIAEAAARARPALERAFGGAEPGDAAQLAVHLDRVLDDLDADRVPAPRRGLVERWADLAAHSLATLTAE